MGNRSAERLEMPAPSSATASQERDDVRARLRFPATLVAPCLLLLLAERPGHGYELIERLRAFGFAGSRTASLYRELRLLEEAGFVSSHWEATEGRGPARRVYEVTPSGIEALLGCAENAEYLARVLQRYVRRVRAVSRGSPVWGNRRRP